MAHSVPTAPGARFTPGAAVLEREQGSMFWRGGSTCGFTAEIAADGSVNLGTSQIDVKYRRTLTHPSNVQYV